MSGDSTLRDLLEVQAHFGLPSPALVEKDFHVVKALAAIATSDTGSLRLVFGGGTALGRAHRLIRRMLEDIDFRIVSEDQPNISNGSRRYGRRSGESSGERTHRSAVPALMSGSSSAGA